MTNLLDNVVQTMHSNVASLINARVGRSADRNMVRRNPAVRKSFLQGHPDGGPAAPDRYDHRWLETAFEYFNSELDRVFQQVLGGKYGFVHRYSLVCGPGRGLIMADLNSTPARRGNNTNE
jgi:hypothetical protein